MFRWVILWINLFFIGFVMRNESIREFLLFSVFVVLTHIFGILLSMIEIMEKKQ